MKDTFEQPSKNCESEGITADPRKKYFKITKVKGDSKKNMRDFKLQMKKEEITREEIKENL
jgi:hypothetical protein